VQASNLDRLDSVTTLDDSTIRELAGPAGDLAETTE
jgi:hypothetical protein